MNYAQNDANCSDFVFSESDISSEELSSDISALEPIEDIFVDFSSEKAITVAVQLYISSWIWPTIALVFLILAFLPLCITRLCCPSRCCPPRSQYILTGYPSQGFCVGYLVPTIFFIIFWCLVTALCIAIPLTLGKFGENVNQISCVVAESTSILLGQVADVFQLVVQTADSVVDSIKNIGDRIAAEVDKILVEITDDVTTLNSIINNLESGCVNIKASEAFQNLTELSPEALDYDCNDFTNDVQFLPAIEDVQKAVIDGEKALEEGIEAALNETDTIVSEAEGETLNYKRIILDGARFLNEKVDLISIPIILPEPGTYTISLAIKQVTSKFPLLGTLLCALIFLGLLLWISGILGMFCLTCKRRNNQGGRASRAQEVQCSCGLRCLTKTGCISTYFGTFVLSIASIVFLVAAPVLTTVLNVYYIAPFQSNEIVDLLSKLGFEFNLDSQIISTVITDIFIKNLPTSEVVESLGYNVSILTDYLQVDLNAGGLNISDEVINIQNKIVAANNSLKNERYSESEIAMAARASKYCCGYKNLFSLFVSDCNTLNSPCDNCESISSSCSEPTLCNPDPGLNGGVDYECNAWAANAYTIMMATNDLINDQFSGINRLSASANTIENAKPVEYAQTQINDFIDGLPDFIISQINKWALTFIPTIYYGIYENFMKPVINSFNTVAALTAAVALLVIVLIFISIPVNIRLGNDGINVNRISQNVESSLGSVEHEEVAVEMSVSIGANQRLPVAEPIMGVENDRNTLYSPKGKQAYED